MKRFLALAAIVTPLAFSALPSQAASLNAVPTAKQKRSGPPHTRSIRPLRLLAQSVHSSMARAGPAVCPLSGNSRLLMLDSRGGGFALSHKNPVIVAGFASGPVSAASKTAIEARKARIFPLP